MAQLRIVAMVLIHSMDSDEEPQVQTYEEPDAYVVNTIDSRSGIKMDKTSRRKVCARQKLRVRN